MPSILLLLAAGIAARALVGVNPDDLIGESLLFPMVSLSVAVILFEGGLTLQLRELREFGAIVIRLVTIGVAIAWVLTAVLAWLLYGMDPRVATLTGAILVVTGPTVIAPATEAHPTCAAHCLRREMGRDRHRSNRSDLGGAHVQPLVGRTGGRCAHLQPARCSRCDAPFQDNCRGPGCCSGCCISAGSHDAELLDSGLST